MKYLYLLITLFILAACGPSEEEAASEPTPPPVNVFEGTYVGIVFGAEVSASVEGSSIYFDDEEEPCVIEDPYSTTTVYNCEGEEESGNMIIDEDNTITITFNDLEDFEVVLERVSGPVR